MRDGYLDGRRVAGMVKVSRPLQQNLDRSTVWELKCTHLLGLGVLEHDVANRAILPVIPVL